jgi:hypothetical protein
MKTKIVVWGSNQNDEKILIALELLAKENKVNIYTFPEKVATEELYNNLYSDWREGKEMEMPGGHEVIQRELSASEELLPDEIKISKGNIIERVKTEWHFMVLSAKLSEMYHSELNDFKEKVADLKTFDSIVWNELKQFWAKVQDQVRERNLFRDHANNLRNQTNDLFTSLKSLRKTLDDDFKRISKENSAKFSTSLQTIEEKISGGLGLQPLFEELKKLQKEFKDTKFTKDDRAAIWNRLDKAFKDVKEKRFGKSNNKSSGSSPLDRLQRRYDGLLSAIKKMENSIDRDKREIRHQDDRISKTDGQLEAQLRQAKIKMTNERIRSKEEKLSEMMRTKTDLDKRFEIEKAKEAKRQERLKVENKKKEVEAKIAAEIKEAAEKRKEEDGKLIKAATAISAKPKAAEEKAVEEKPTENEVPIEKVVETPSEEEATPVESIAESAENMVDKVSTMISETLEDVVDTVKAVAEVIENKAEEVMDSINEEEE